MYYKTVVSSPIGEITLCSDGNSLVGLWIGGQKYFANIIKSEMINNDELHIFKLTKEWLNKYFDGKNPDINELPMSLIGSEFRQTVWKILIEIPYGTVITYGEIAKRIAKEREVKRMSSQAVGNAVGHNPISIIIPCHRVIGTNGNLTGYAGGIDKKIKLLKHEEIDFNKYNIKLKGDVKNKIIFNLHQPKEH